MYINVHQTVVSMIDNLLPGAYLFSYQSESHFSDHTLPGQHDEHVRRANVSGIQPITAQVRNGLTRRAHRA